MAPYGKDGSSPYAFFRPIFTASNPALHSDRSESEKLHKTARDYSFYKPLTITPEVLNSRLSLSSLHESCNKACAIYCIPNIPYPGPLGSNSRTSMFHAVYNTWYVPNECCIVYGAYAAQLIGCWDRGSPKDIPGILKSHAELCEQVERRQHILDEADMLEPSSRSDKECHGNFTLTRSFRAVVIIIDKEDWRKEGVLLVRTADEEGLKTWPIPSAQACRDGIRMELWEAVAVVLKMQRDIETAEEKALRLVPEMAF